MFQPGPDFCLPEPERAQLVAGNRRKKNARLPLYFYLIMESAEWASLGQAIPLTMPPTSLKFGGGVFFSYEARIIALVESVTPAPCQSVSALEKERERDLRPYRRVGRHTL
jgi:hypothetical protein